MQAGESIVPDLQIFVSEVSGDPKTLSFRATAADPRLGFGTFFDCGQTTLRVDPNRYLDGLFSQLEVSGADAFARLEDAGVRLFEELLPFELRRRLWRARSQVSTLFVVTAEAWIPWELLKLQDPEGDEIGPFFAEAFAMGRWLSTSGQRSSAALQLPLRRLGLIFPADSGLPQAKHEKRELLAHAGESRQIVEIGAERAEIARAMSEGSFDGWHFCGHGQIAEGEIEPWYLQIEADTFDPNQLHGRARRLGANHPLIFLNACHGGRAGEGLAGLAGLPASFLRIGAGAFIGPLWQVSDDGAALFARVFYNSFLGGASLGAAIREARSQLRQEDPADPTWLAYIVLGHPSALCREGLPASVAEAAVVPPPPSVLAAAGREAPIVRGGARPARRASSATGSPISSRVAWLRAVAALILVGGLLAGLSSWRLPTPVRLEGRASRISARLGAEGAALLGDGIAYQRLTAGRLAAAEVVGPGGSTAQFTLGSDGLLIAAGREGNSGAAVGTLARLKLAGSQRVVWEAERLSQAVALHIEGTIADAAYEMVLPLPFEVKSPQDLEAGLSGGETTLLRLFPGEGGLLLDAELPPAQPSEPSRRLADRAILLDQLQFVDPRPFAGISSTLREMKISYPGEQGRKSQRLGADAIVELAAEDSFKGTLLELDASTGEIVFAFEGQASLLRAGTSGNLRDLRLTALETYFKAWMALIVMIAAIVASQARGWLRSVRLIPARAGEERIR